MIIYIPEDISKLETTVKARLLDPKNTNATKLFIKLQHCPGSNNAPNEKVLLSRPCIELLKTSLPPKITYISIDEGDFTQWLNKENVGINLWVDEPLAEKPPLFNEILNFFNELNEQITELDLSQSILFTSPPKVPNKIDTLKQTRHNNLKAIIKLLNEKPLTYLGLNHGDFNFKGKHLNQWIKAHLPPTLHTIKLDNLKEEQRIAEPTIIPEDSLIRHQATLLYFTGNITTLDMSCPYPLNNLFNVRDRTITAENVTYFTNLFSRYMEEIDEDKRAEQLVLEEDFPAIYPGKIKTINLSRRNLHKWAAELNNVPAQPDAHHFITQLWLSIPRSVHKIILKGNQLAALSVENLEKFFDAFPPWASVELSDNGFNQLPFTELNEKLAVLPSTTLEFETEKLYLRQDKKVIFVENLHDNKTKLIPFHKIKHQKKVADNLEDSVKSSNEADSFKAGITKEDINKLLTYVPHNSEFREECNQQQLLQWIAAPISPESAIPAQQNQTVENAISRIDLFVSDNNKKYHLPKNTTLDLSFACLSCLERTQLKAVFSNVPEYVTRLILSNNGFATNDDALKNLNEALMSLKNSNSLYIDLSKNAFYTKKYAPINRFLSKCPSNILISITTDTPAQVTEHKSRIGSLDEYHTEARKHQDLLSFAQVLLNSYTMNDNIFLLIICLKIGREHLSDVSSNNQEIVHGTSKNNPDMPSQKLENSDDLLVQLNNYQNCRPSSDLALRVAALSIFSEVLPLAHTSRGLEVPPDSTNLQVVPHTSNH